MVVDEEKKYFDWQLDFNKKQLSGKESAPPHWKHLINDIKTLIKNDENIDTIRDLGCGTGAIYKVILNHFDNGNYYGYDKSEYAIELAKNNWSKDNFFVFDISDIDVNFIKGDNEILYMSALLDVLPNANDHLKKIVELNFKYILIHRVKIVIDQPSFSEEYMAIGVMPSYVFSHNLDEIIQIIGEKYDYEIYENDWGNYFNIRLIRKDKND
jgi:SAM-dependent methyltransferase